MNKEIIEGWFQDLQNNICNDLEAADGKAVFLEDKWDRPDGGGGRTRVIQNGNVIEKGGVNFSAVHGPTPTKILEALNIEKADFYATGVSIVMHPQNPMVPIIHMNVRYFQMSSGTSWFGGGIDLTPHYVNREDAIYFHSHLKSVCDAHHASYYKEFKNWADDYFYIKHRKETRGVGGIFFDRLGQTEDFSLEDRWKFVQAVGSSFAPIYTNLMGKNKNLPYSKENEEWQCVRRGRYVEFNLVWDKGTKFGLDTDGRTESILMSLPPMAHWHYNHQPAQDSEEFKTLSLLKKGIDWV